jgi:N-glycosylase/DNA lyase
MDVFTFTSEMVKSLAWPSATIYLVFLLRKPIIELIPLMKKLKYKELELEFSQEIQDLKYKSNDALPEKQKPLEKTATSKALDLVSYSTRAAIIEAWIELEAAAVEVASSFWDNPPSDVFRNDPKLGEYLHKCKVLDDKQLVIYNKLRHLRNKSAHAEDLNLSESDARSYVEMASHLINHIKKCMNEI